MSSYYELRQRMAAYIENTVSEDEDGAPRNYFYYNIAKDLGLGRKAVDQYIDSMIIANRAVEREGRIVRR